LDDDPNSFFAQKTPHHHRCDVTAGKQNSDLLCLVLVEIAACRLIPKMLERHTAKYFRNQRLG